MRLWFLWEVQRKALLISGKDRHAKFLELLAKRMQGKGSLVGDLEDKGSREDDRLDVGNSS